MTEENTRYGLREENAEPSYFAMIPHMAMLDLDPYALALYCQYKKVIAENPDGQCYMTNRNLAKQAQMSVSRMKNARAELVRRNYIQIIQHPDDDGNINTPPTIVLKNLWALNKHICETELQKQGKGGVAKKQGESPKNGGGVAKKPPLIKVSEEEVKEKESMPAPKVAGDVPQDSKKEDNVPEQQGTVTTSAPDQEELVAPAPRRRKHPAEDWHHALARSFRLDPEQLMKNHTADGNYWKVATELKACGITFEQVTALHQWVQQKAKNEGWKSYTVNALAKYALDFLASLVEKVPDGFENLRPVDWGINSHVWQKGGSS